MSLVNNPHLHQPFKKAELKITGRQLMERDALTKKGNSHKETKINKENQQQAEVQKLKIYIRECEAHEKKLAIECCRLQSILQICLSLGPRN